MSDDTNPYDGMPSGRLARLKYSISNLWDDFGHVDNLAVGVMINLALVLSGVAIAIGTDGWVSMLGVAWAVLNAYPLVQWVIGR